ncbi:MAG: histidinol-phosphate transaminase [Pseudomonadota bacterium]
MTLQQKSGKPNAKINTDASTNTSAPTNTREKAKVDAPKRHRPRPRDGILSIAAYKPGASKGPSKEAGEQRVFKLSSNESALGPSPNTIKALSGAGRSIHLYPDGSATALREIIADVHGLDPRRVICGTGSDELLQLLPRAYAGPGDSIVQTEHGFLVYAIAAQSCGATPRYAKETNLTADVDAILGAVDETTRMVFLANPNNPTGTYLPDHEIIRLHEGLPSDVILVLDGAYAEYITQADYEPGATLVDEFDNVVMTRTFSKIYGLGGLRLGWGYFPTEIADVVNRIRGPFNVSAPAIDAGIAAMKDQRFVGLNRDHNTAERNRMAKRLQALGLRLTPSVCNFLLINIPSTDGKSASDAVDFLAKRNILVRNVSSYKLPDWIRVSIGPTDANDAFLDGIEAYLSHA